MDHQRAEDPGRLLETLIAGHCSHLPQQQIPVHIFPPQQATEFFSFAYLLRVREKMRFFQCGNHRRSCCLSALDRKTTAAFYCARFHRHHFSVSKSATASTCQIQPGVGRELEAHRQPCGIPHHVPTRPAPLPVPHTYREGEKYSQPRCNF